VYFFHNKAENTAGPHPNNTIKKIEIKYKKNVENKNKCVRTSRANCSSSPLQQAILLVYVVNRVVYNMCEAVAFGL
jgi:hypothetical protein